MMHKPPTEEELFQAVATLYPANTEIFQDPFSTNEYCSRNRLCQQVLSDEGLMQRWQHCKNELDRVFDKYNKTTYDSELLCDAPSLRYGIEALSTPERQVQFSFHISVVMPYYGWYFLDYEKYPKEGNVTRQKLGPPVSKFTEMNLLSEYEMLNSGKLGSPLEISLTGWDLIDFLMPAPRFASTNNEEQWIVESTKDIVTKHFADLASLPIDLAQRKVDTIARKGHMGGPYYNLFECLFLADLSYC